MQILSYFFFVYLAGALLVTARLGWHMVFRLDRYDWRYSKSEIWVSFALATLLWPLLLRMPRTILDPSKFFEGNGNAARARFREKPPPCSAVIQYRQGYEQLVETF